MSIMMSVVVTFYAISFLIMGLFVWEYWHIHGKRMELLRALQWSKCSRASIHKYILTIVYISLTFAIMIGTLLFFIQSHVISP